MPTVFKRVQRMTTKTRKFHLTLLRHRSHGLCNDAQLDPTADDPEGKRDPPVWTRTGEAWRGEDPPQHLRLPQLNCGSQRGEQSKKPKMKKKTTAKMPKRMRATNGKLVFQVWMPVLPYFWIPGRDQPRFWPRSFLYSRSAISYSSLILMLGGRDSKTRAAGGSSRPRLRRRPLLRTTELEPTIPSQTSAPPDF